MPQARVVPAPALPASGHQGALLGPGDAGGERGQQERQTTDHCMSPEESPASSMRDARFGSVIMLHDSSYFFSKGAHLQNMSFAVLRLGPSEEEVKVTYRIRPISQTSSGEYSYVPCSGIITLPAGVSIQEQRIEAAPGPRCWELMEFFKVELIGVVAGRAQLGHTTEADAYLVADDGFPNGDTLPLAEGGMAHLQLYLSFLKLRWRLHWKALTTALCAKLYDSIHSVFGFAMLVYIINEVLLSDENQENDEVSEDKEGKWRVVLSLTTAYLVSAVIDWKCSSIYLAKRKSSSTLKELRTWLVTKYLWYSETAHERVEFQGDFKSITIQRAEEAIELGWTGHLLVIGDVLELLVQYVFLLVISSEEGQAWLVGLLLAIIPFAAIVVILRGKELLQLLDLRCRAENEWMEALDDVAANWRLMSVYNMRSQQTEKFAAKCKAFQMLHKKAKHQYHTTEHFVMFGTEVCVAGAILAGVWQYMDGNISVGLFSAMIAVIQRIGDVLADLAGRVVEIQRAILALVKVAEELNEPTGLLDQVRQQSKERDAANTQLGPDVPKHKRWKLVPLTTCLSWSSTHKSTPANTLSANNPLLTCITMKHVAFKYPLVTGCTHGPSHASWQPPLTTDLTCQLPLGGGVVALRAHVGAGVLTVLKLIGGQLFPDSGFLYVPPHFNVVLLQEPLLFNDTLWNNLTLGNKYLHQQKGSEQVKLVWDICRSLGLSSFYLQQADYQVGRQGSNLRTSDRICVCLVRALLSNVDILLLSKVTAPMRASEKKRVFAVLNDWRTKSGLFASPLLSSNRISSVRSFREEAGTRTKKADTCTKEDDVPASSPSHKLMAAISDPPRTILISAHWDSPLPSLCTHVADFRRDIAESRSKQIYVCSVKSLK